MDKLEISEIQIVPIKPQNGLCAFISAVINHQFYIGNIALYTSPLPPAGSGWFFRIKTGFWPSCRLLLPDYQRGRGISNVSNR